MGRHGFRIDARVLAGAQSIALRLKSSPSRCAAISSAGQ
jgi:hypothetical protein